MRKYFENVIIYFQITLLYISYVISKILGSETMYHNWVIGVDEIASTLFFTGNVLQPSTTVCLQKNRL